MSKRPAEETVEALEAQQQSTGPQTPKRVRLEEVIDQEFAEKGSSRNGMILEASRPRAPVPAADMGEDEEEEEEEEEDVAVGQLGVGKAQEGPSEGFSDLYLDTINRYGGLFSDIVCPYVKFTADVNFILHRVLLDFGK